MPEPGEIDASACERLLRAGTLGRVGLSTPEGPHIVAVVYVVVDDTIVVRTSAYTVLGSYATGAMLAFEVDDVDDERGVGWSVLARGLGWAEQDPGEVARIRHAWRGRPRATGAGNLYLRMRWTNLTGRWLGGDATVADESGASHTLTAR